MYKCEGEVIFYKSNEDNYVPSDSKKDSDDDLSEEN